MLRGDRASRRPPPGLDELPALIDRARLAGLDAELVERGRRRPVPADLAAAAYRLVQEAVTNTVRHSSARTIRAGLDWGPAAAAVMATLAAPALGLRLAQVDARLLPAETQTRQVVDATVAHFPQLDRPAPIVVAAAGAGGAEVAALRDRIAAVPHVTEARVARSGPVSVLLAGLDQPAHSTAARQAVAAIRALGTPYETAVTGDTATLVDYQETITDRLPYAVAIIAAGTMLLLFLFTGSVLLPVKAVATNLLSIGAAVGVVDARFGSG